MTLEVPTFTRDGLEFRAWRLDDAPAALELAQDPVARQWMAGLRPVDSLTAAQAWVTRRLPEVRIDWIVRDRANGDVVGRVGLHHLDQENRNADTGYVVWPAHRGRGVATAMVQTATAYAFESLGLHRVALLHAVGNVASCRVAARCGFAFEGVERQALDHGDGIRHDEHRHARLATDPPGRVPAPPADRPPIEPAQLTVGQLLLRPPSLDEAEDALRMLADPDVVMWNPGPEALDLDEARAWCARLADWSDGSHTTFSVLDATSGRLLGNVSLHGIDPVQRDAQVGYRVAPWARGQGVGTEALAAVSRWAFDALDLHRIELAHAVENPASCRVAEKAGFRREGTLRQSFTYGDGRRHDEHVHARLASD